MATATSRHHSSHHLGPSWLFENEGEGPVLEAVALLRALDHRWGAFRALTYCKWGPHECETILADLVQALRLFDYDLLDWRDAMKDSLLGESGSSTAPPEGSILPPAPWAPDLSRTTLWALGKTTAPKEWTDGAEIPAEHWRITRDYEGASAGDDLYHSPPAAVRAGWETPWLALYPNGDSGTFLTTEQMAGALGEHEAAGRETGIEQKERQARVRRRMQEEDDDAEA